MKFAAEAIEAMLFKPLSPKEEEGQVKDIVEIVPVDISSTFHDMNRICQGISDKRQLILTETRPPNSRATLPESPVITAVFIAMASEAVTS